MNKRQKIVLCVGIAVIILMVLLPPTIGKELVEGHGLAVERYKFLFAIGDSQIDRSKLCLQFLIVVLPAGSLFSILRDKKPKDK